MGILADMTTEKKLAQALKFVKVDLTKEGYLTGVSVAMIMVEMRCRGLNVSVSNGEQPTEGK